VPDVAAHAGEAYAIAFKRDNTPDAWVIDYYLRPGKREAENGLNLALRLPTSGPCVLKVLIVNDHHALG
jgi:hypothetical protein